MTPSRAPRSVRAARRVADLRAARPRRRSSSAAPSAKKARNRLSGDQKGAHASSVPGKGWAVERVERPDPDPRLPFESVALNARMRPSGEMRGTSIVATSGGRTISKRTARGGFGARWTKPTAQGRGRDERRGEPPGELLAVLAPRDDGRRQPGLRAALGDPLQLQHHVVRRLPAVARDPWRGSLDDPVERRRDHRLDRRDRRRVRVQDRADQAAPGSSPWNAFFPVSHLVEHAAEREDVAARVGLVALELLGRHVLERPEDRAARRSAAALLGAVGRPSPATAAPAARRRACARPKSSSFTPVFVSMTLPGLRSRWTMPCAVRRVERVGDLDRRSRSACVGRQRALAEAVRQRLALEQLHDEVVGPVLVADVVERADVRVVERRDRPRLALEALRAARRSDDRSRPAGP